MSSERNGKLRFNLFVTLVLALVVTGFGRPGFLLKYLQPKAPEVPGEAKARPEQTPRVGHSDPFSVSPLPGITISAERDALDRNREFKVAEMARDAFSRLQDRVADTIPGLLLMAGWDVDAGMTDEEWLPGTYTVGIDLSRLGIPARLRNLLTAYRVDDKGHLYEYVTWVKDNILYYASSQNSGTVIGVDEVAAVTGKDMSIPSPAPQTGFFEKDGYYCVRNPSEPEKTQYKFYYDDAEVKDLRYVQHSMIIVKKRAQAKKMAEEQLPNASSSEISDRQLEILERMYDEDPAYREAMDSRYYTRKEQNENNRELIGRLGTMVYEAHKYLEGLGLKMPALGTRIYLVKSMDDAAEAKPVSLFGPYVNIGMNALVEGGKEHYDDVQSTLAHELFHVCQFRYNGACHANVKFYEAMAQLLEEEANRYFHTHTNVAGTACIITTDATKSLENGYRYEYFAMPFDAKLGNYSTPSVTYYSESGGQETWTLDDNTKTLSAYPMARFLEYLNASVGKKSFKEIMETHESVVAYVDFGARPFIEHLGTTWCLTDEEMTKAFLGFAKKYRTTFYDYLWANANKRKTGIRTIFPITFMRSGTQHFKLNNHNYTIRLRQVLKGADGKVANLVAPDPDFARTLSDMTLMPVGTNLWTKCKHGIFFYPDLEDRFYLMEIDGGTNPDTAAVSGYTVYELRPPAMEPARMEDGLLCYTLPEMSQAAKDGKIDGYRITITCTDGKKSVFYPSILHAGKTVKQKTSHLNNGKHEEGEEVGYTVTVCEYIRDGKRRLFGPESGDGSMDALLEEMGAMEGEITASIYWPSKDDLDLHCNTPDGSHIYYNNKSAGGGTLDVDMQVQGDRDSGVENIFFAEPAAGTYEFYVDNYRDRTEGDTPCRVRIKAGNQIMVDETVSMGGKSRTWKLNYRGRGREENVEILQDSP